jgi:hypothetical protein
MDDPTCPKCGSINVCQEWLTAHEYGWVCDHCGHEWDIEVPERDADDGPATARRDPLPCRLEPGPGRPANDTHGEG